MKDELTRPPYARMAAENHTQYYCAMARGSSGEIMRRRGCLWTYDDEDGEGMVLFPQLGGAAADDEVLDELIEWYCERNCRSLIGCWSLDPPAPKDLGVGLLARGFQPGWRPRWMGRKLDDLTDLPSPPDDVQIREARSGKAHAARPHPQCRRFEAVRNGEVIGHSSVFLSTGEYAAAGIYDVHVLPAERNRGVGKAVTAAAMIKGRSMGARFAVLNATGPRMYEQLGLTGDGFGRTWWLNVPRLRADRPSRERIALAEAVGRGDTKLLESRFAESLDALATPMTCGLSLLELAAHEGQPEAAKWLLEHGARPDIISMWDLGLRREAAELLAKQPTAARWRAGELGATPLHIAAERNDVELARLLLSADPDLTFEDPAFGSTPEGWARHFKRRKILGMIRAHARSANLKTA
ncbi:MAG: GNAT family N-acetyltransferase [Armatimonadetes bacterium]|nr:GNAT family N-acetyltransferase [Armatimonadota bacterium]MDE2206979.1 GNAT family N-acetyltransferase [Armatimonadota bacterium]